MVFASQGDKRLAGLGLNVGSVNHDELPDSQALGADEMQYLKRVFGCDLVVFVVRDQGPAEVGGEDLCWFEMLAGKGRFAGAGRSDKDNEREFRNCDPHFNWGGRNDQRAVKIAI